MTRRAALATGRPVILAILAVLVAGCLGGADPVPASSGSPPSSAAPSASAVAVTPGVGDPPAASIGVEGGDPVVGQLGSYDWAGGGSSSPWLPGAPVAVGAQETLAITFEPPMAATAWTARIAETTDLAGTDAVAYASGTGQPVMGAPRSGSWTLAVTVRFGEFGSATYTWRLDVT